MPRNLELAELVQAARRRAFYCERHDQRQICIDCILEARFGREIRTVAEIMNAFV